MYRRNFAEKKGSTLFRGAILFALRDHPWQKISGKIQNISK
jgi:hypothetical protein